MSKISYLKKFVKGFGFLFCLILFLLNSSVKAQNVTITDDESYTPDNSAMLDVKSTNKGMLVPRLDSAQRVGISYPALGLLVFDTTKNSFMYYNGSNWITIPQLITSAGSGDALFAVVNHLGDTVFAVYHDGVRVFVDPTAKGSVGGFAVSGRTRTKEGEKVEYFRVTPDSTRIYVNDSVGVKGSVGGFAVSGRTRTKEGEIKEYFTINKDSTRIYIDSSATKGSVGGFAVSGRTRTKGNYIPDDYFNVSAGSNADSIPSDARIAWYPKKEAFLAGRVQVLSPDSVGKNSFATGFHSMAKGDYSQAFGYEAKARGDYSTAIGKNAVANTNNTFAFGDGAQALAENSYAFGSGAISSGLGSYAFGAEGRDAYGNPTGIVTKASGDYSLAIGYGAIASGIFSVSLGYSCTASGTSSFATGRSSISSGDYSCAIGLDNNATNFGSIAVGYRNTSSGRYSFSSGEYNYAATDKTVAMGWENDATAPCAVALGNNCTASGWRSFAVGYNSVAGGGYSQTQIYGPTMALGKSVKVYGPNAIGTGYNTTARGYNSFCAGYYTSSQSYLSVVFGRYNIISGDTINWVSTDPLFVIGNGTSDGARSNAITILKNGNVGIGTSNPLTKLSFGTYYINSTAPTSSEQTSHIRLYDDGSSVYYGLGVSTNALNIAANQSTGTIRHYTNSIERLRIDANGNVGIGTIPTYNLDVNGEITSRSGNAFRLRNTTYSAFLRNDNSSFYILLTNSGDPDGIWNSLRPLAINITNGDVNLGGTLQVSHLANVGIGTTSPASKLHVTPGQVRLDGTANPYIGVNNGTYQGYFEITSNILALTYNSAVRLGITSGGLLGIGRTATVNTLEVNGSASKTFAGDWLANSDQRIKTDITEIENACETMLKLHPVKFKYSNEYKKSHDGVEDKFYYNFIAQEYQQVFPESVKGSGEYINGLTDEILQMDSYNAQIVSIKAVQDLIIQNKQQQQQIELLKSELEAIKEEIRGK